MKNKKIIAIIAAAVIVAGTIVALVASNNSKTTTQTDTPETAVITPAPDDAAENKEAEEKKAEAEEKAEEKKQENKEEPKEKAPEPEKKPDNNEEKNTAPAEKEEQKVFTPTFMYFVSEKDDGYTATNVIIDELKKEYEGKVNFDIRNIDEDPELTKNFPVGDGNTPTLIMLNTKNEISNILFKTSDKEKLKSAIDAALAQ